MSLKNSIFSIVFAFFLLLAPCPYDGPVCSQELEIAFSYDIPPFIMNMGTEGLEPEIVREALKYRGHTYRVKQCSYKRLEIAVAKMGLDGAAAVREKDDGTYYSNNFIAFENYAISKRKSGIVLNSISDLKGKSIVTWQNAHRDLGDEFAALFSPDVKAPYTRRYHEVSVQKNQVEMFWVGRSDVTIIDKSIFIWFTKQLGEKIPAGVEPVFHKIFPIPTEYQVNFKSRDMRDDFNEGLKHIRKSGVYQQIFDKYLK